MSAAPENASELWLVRHGETEWSRDGRHTSTTELPLTETGVQVAGQLAEVLKGETFERVVTSPRQRARRTAELAGFGGAEVDEDLAEWGYGDYEGITTPQIRETVPRWTVWTHPTPGGETPEQVTERLARVVEAGRARDGRTLVFGHGHALRALTALWLGLPVTDGRLFKLDTSTVSVLGFERDVPVVVRWNA
jgi:broad specificity phosphatase PhoE